MAETGETLWYKDAIIYQTHVKSYYDGNNDGVGDFRGLTEKLDYIRSLGVSAIWLLPFYPSPLRDDGYDIADYMDINPTYGTMEDFKTFVREAKARGLKVITELVINHTSDQHPWFQRARQAPRGSVEHDFYVWSDDDRKWPETRIIFTDTEPSNWSWDPVAKRYYWHRFFSHQPDLNFDNPEVMKAVIEIMRFWLDMGVDGLRLDAIPYLVERDGTNNENLPETHAVLKELRRALDESHPHAFFLAEANQWPEDTRPYFGDGDECHMGFHFPLMPRMYMAIAQEDRFPITDILRQTPEIPESCQWAVFLRNHDELTLEMVTDRERDYLWRFYAAEKRARINVGIRRRLAPLMENDRRKIELLNSLLFSMPGTPIVYYGDEIGMGDNIYLGDRDGVRTPMQWSPDRNGGFSRADPARLYLPAIMDPVYGFQTVNVEAHERTSFSLLNWMRRIMRVRQRHQAFGRGALSFLYPGNRKVFAYLREFGGETILCVANLSRTAQAVELDLSRFRGRVPVELLDGTLFPPVGPTPYLFTLAGYGFQWFVLSETAEPPAWYEPTPEPVPELFTLVLREGWRSLAAGRAHDELQRDVLPPFLANQNWSREQRPTAIRLTDLAPLPSVEGGDPRLMAALVEAEEQEGCRYFLPMALLWDEGAIAPGAPTLPYTLAKARRANRVGALVDATVEPDFARTMAGHIRAGTALPAAKGTLRFIPGDALHALPPATAETECRRIGTEQGNTAVVIGEQVMLKVYRRLQAGIHPEPEVLRHLAGVAPGVKVPTYLGHVEYAAEDGTTTALAVLQGFVRNQGDGWTLAVDMLTRELESARSADFNDMPAEQRFQGFLPRATALGTRLGELHRALAQPSDDPAFAPEPFARADLDALGGDLRDLAAKAFAALAAVGDAVPGADRMAGREEGCRRLIARLTAAEIAAQKTRIHGDMQLANVLVEGADFVFVDFEADRADPARRRVKDSPLRDVARMLRSFDQAAWTAALAVDPLSPERFEDLIRLAQDWRRLTRDAFRRAYAEALGDNAVIPREAEDADRLLDLYRLLRALVEIIQDSAQQPQRLGAPLRLVEELFERWG
ncbi:MAG TPA: maltose alpha-D-glucosyltransferase [Alphaproteobacteria bacterium]|nr:maltose alpha-D-glucosyltransferase [Alphaproteobacteria bacterium]